MSNNDPPEDGPVFTRYLSKELESECYYCNGKKHGSAKLWYQSGKLKSKGNYCNGKKHGEWIEYFESGYVMSKGKYENGVQEGPWVYYMDKGHLNNKGDYKNNTRIGPWYNSDGKLKCNYTEQLWRLTQKKNKSVWGDDRPEYYVDYIFKQEDVDLALYYGL